MTDKELKEYQADPSYEPIVDETREDYYKAIMGHLGKRQTTFESQMGNNLFEDLLHEKSMDLTKFMFKRPADDAEQSLNQLSEDVVRYGQKFEKTKLGAEDLEYLSEDVIKSKIDEFMETVLEPEAEAGQVDEDGQEEISQDIMQTQQAILTDLGSHVDKSSKRALFRKRRAPMKKKA